MNISDYKRAAAITADIKELEQKLSFWEGLKSKLSKDAANPAIRHDKFTPVLILQNWTHEAGNKEMKLDDLADNGPLSVLAKHYCERFAEEIAEKEKLFAEI